MRRRWSAVVLVAFVVLCAGLAQTRPGHALLQDAGLFQAPSSDTELAFTSPAVLPLQLKSPHTPIGVSFDIHNVSSSSRRYQWSIVLVGSGQSRVSATGAVNMPALGHATVARAVTAACDSGRLQVVVRLTAPAESIFFWVTCPLDILRA
jgi:hypothetical protein